MSVYSRDNVCDVWYDSQ